MLRKHDKLPDEVDRQDPDFIEEYKALIEAEAQITREGKEPIPTRTPDGEKRELTFNEKKAIADRVRARHAAARQRLLH